jgi:hypothetical protein
MSKSYLRVNFGSGRRVVPFWPMLDSPRGHGCVARPRGAELPLEVEPIRSSTRVPYRPAKDFLRGSLATEGRCLPRVQIAIVYYEESDRYKKTTSYQNFQTQAYASSSPRPPHQPPALHWRLAEARVRQASSISQPLQRSLGYPWLQRPQSVDQTNSSHPLEFLRIAFLGRRLRLVVQVCAPVVFGIPRTDLGNYGLGG